MNEYVKAVKVIHQLLILAASAVLAFALTPNLEPQYERADATLSLLQNCKPDSWDEYVLGILGNSDKSETKYIHQLVHNIDPTFPSDARIPLFFYSDLHYPLNGNIVDIEQYLRMKQRIQTVSFRREQGNFYLQWQNATSNQNASQSTPADNSQRLRIATILISPPGGSWSGTKLHLVPIDNQNNDRNATMMINLDPNSMARPRAVSNTVTVNMPIILNPVQEQLYALNWLQQEDTEKILFTNGVSNKNLFRSLDPFIKEIGGMGVSQARQRLQAKREAQHGKISLFGLSVDEQSTVMVMPWIISGILLFFLAHLRQFRSVASKISIEESPWVGFFNDWMGQIISFVTMVVMPTFASYLLARRHSEQPNIDRTVVVSLVVVAVLSVWNYLELLRLRSKLKHGRVHSIL